MEPSIESSWVTLGPSWTFFRGATFSDHRYLAPMNQGQSRVDPCWFMTATGEWLRVGLQQGASGVWHLPSLHDSGVMQRWPCFNMYHDISWHYYESWFRNYNVNINTWYSSMFQRFQLTSVVFAYPVYLSQLSPWAGSWLWSSCCCQRPLWLQCRLEQFLPSTLVPKRSEGIRKSVGQLDLRTFLNTHTQSHIIRCTSASETFCDMELCQYCLLYWGMVTRQEALVLHKAWQRLRRIKPTCCGRWLWHGLEACSGLGFEPTAAAMYGSAFLSGALDPRTGHMCQCVSGWYLYWLYSPIWSSIETVRRFFRQKKARTMTSRIGI